MTHGKEEREHELEREDEGPRREPSAHNQRPVTQCAGTCGKQERTCGARESRAVSGSAHGRVRRRRALEGRIEEGEEEEGDVDNGEEDEEVDGVWW